MSNGLDAMKNARENAKAQSQRRHLTPPPPHRRTDASAGTATPEPPNLAIVPTGADSDKASAESASTGAPTQPPTPPAHTPDSPLPRTGGPTSEYLATKAVSDAALAWAAQSRKLALREDSLARAIRAARHAGVAPSALRAAIAAAEMKAADRLDPVAITELLN